MGDNWENEDQFPGIYQIFVLHLFTIHDQLMIIDKILRISLSLSFFIFISFHLRYIMIQNDHY